LGNRIGSELDRPTAHRVLPAFWRFSMAQARLRQLGPYGKNRRALESPSGPILITFARLLP